MHAILIFIINLEDSLGRSAVIKANSVLVGTKIDQFQSAKNIPIR